MRKLLFVVIVVLAFLSLTFRLNNKEEEIRVRIIPNSNEAIDIDVKENVKSIVIDYLKLVYNENYEMCCNNINNKIDELELDLANKFKDITVNFGYHTLYNKTYNDNAIQNKKEKTLYIVIGEGKGDNWWGTIYPEYISGGEEIEYESILINVINKIKEK